MKKLLLCAAALTLGLGGSYAQNKEIAKLEKALAKSDATIADANKAGSAATWIDRSSVLLEASKIYTKNLIADFPIEQTLILLGGIEPNEIVEVTVGDSPYKKYAFDNFDIYVNENGQASFWYTRNEFRAHALDSAVSAIQRAHTLAPAQFNFGNKGYNTALEIINVLNTNGMNLYNLGQKEEAGELFAQIVETNKLVGVTDSVMTYYAGVSFYEAKNWDKALLYFTNACEMNYEQGGEIPSYIGFIYQQQGKLDEAIKTLEAAIVKYPANQTLVTQLIDLYVQTKREPSEIVGMLDKAKELDPKNANLYMLEGSLWDQIGDPEKAEAAFQEAVKIDPTNYQGFVNIAIMQIRKGDKCIEEANKLDINDVKGFNALVDQARPHFNTAIEMLEKAHELNPKDAGIIDLLKNLYYQKQTDDPSAEAKYKHFNELANSLQ